MAKEEIMKLLLLLLVYFLPILTSVADDIEERKITNENVVYFYESRAEFKAPYKDLAGYASSEYLNAQDEFERYDILEQVQPMLEEQLFKFGSINEVILEVGGRLAEYDFEKNAFPIRFSKKKVSAFTIHPNEKRQHTPSDRRQSTLVLFDNKYAVTLTNSDDIKFFPLSVDNARQLASELQKSRRAVFRISGRIVGVKAGITSGLEQKARSAIEVDFGEETICCIPEEVKPPLTPPMKVVEVDVTKVEVTLDSGKKVGKIALSP